MIIFKVHFSFLIYPECTKMYKNVVTRVVDLFLDRPGSPLTSTSAPEGIDLFTFMFYENYNNYTIGLFDFL